MSETRAGAAQPSRGMAPTQQGPFAATSSGAPPPARTLQQQQAAAQLTRLVAVAGSSSGGSTQPQYGGATTGGAHATSRASGGHLLRTPSGRGLRVDATGTHHSLPTANAPLTVVVQHRQAGGAAAHAPVPMALHPPRTGALSSSLRTALPGALGTATAMHGLPPALPPLAARGAAPPPAHAPHTHTARPMSGAMRASAPSAPMQQQQRQQPQGPGALLSRHLSMQRSSWQGQVQGGSGTANGVSAGHGTLGRHVSMPHSHATGAPSSRLPPGLTPLQEGGAQNMQQLHQSRGLEGGALASPQPTLAAVAMGLAGPGSSSSNAAAQYSAYRHNVQLPPHHRFLSHDGEGVGDSGWEVRSGQLSGLVPAPLPASATAITPIRLLQRTTSTTPTSSAVALPSNTTNQQQQQQQAAGLPPPLQVTTSESVPLGPITPTAPSGPAPLSRAAPQRASLRRSAADGLGPVLSQAGGAPSWNNDSNNSSNSSSNNSRSAGASSATPSPADVIEQTLGGAPGLCAPGQPWHAAPRDGGSSVDAVAVPAPHLMASPAAVRRSSGNGGGAAVAGASSILTPTLLSFARRGPLLAPRSGGGAGTAASGPLGAATLLAAAAAAAPARHADGRAQQQPVPANAAGHAWRVESRGSSGCGSRSSSCGGMADGSIAASPGAIGPDTPSPVAHHPAFAPFASPERAWAMYSNAATQPMPSASHGGGAGMGSGTGMGMVHAQPVAGPPTGVRLTPIPLQPMPGPALPGQPIQPQQQHAYVPASQQQVQGTGSWWSVAPDAVPGQAAARDATQPHVHQQHHRFAVGLEGLLQPHTAQVASASHLMTLHHAAGASPGGAPPSASPAHSSHTAAAQQQHTLLHALEQSLLAHHTAAGAPGTISTEVWATTGGAIARGGNNGYSGRSSTSAGSSMSLDSDSDALQDESGAGGGYGRFGNVGFGSGGMDDGRAMAGGSGLPYPQQPQPAAPSSSMQDVVARLYSQFVHPASAVARPGSQQAHPHHLPYQDSRGSNMAGGSEGGPGLGDVYFGPLGTGYVGWGEVQEGYEDDDEEDVSGAEEEEQDGRVIYLGAGHLGLGMLESDEEGDDRASSQAGEEEGGRGGSSSRSSGNRAGAGGQGRVRGDEPVTARWRSHTPSDTAPVGVVPDSETLSYGGQQQRDGARSRSHSRGSSDASGPVLGPHGFRPLLPPGALDRWGGPPMTPEASDGNDGEGGAPPRFRRAGVAAAAGGPSGGGGGGEREGQGPEVGRPPLHFVPPPSAPAAVSASRSEGALMGLVANTHSGGRDEDEEGSSPDSREGGLSGMLRLPFQHFMSRHAANLLLPHHMRHMADMFTPDMLWRQPLPATSNTISGSSGAGPSGSTTVPSGTTATSASRPFGKTPSARSGSRGASRGGDGAGGGVGGAGALGPGGVPLTALREVSAVELFCGRYPTKAVRALAGDAGFMGTLLAGLPAVDVHSPCVAAVIAGLQGRSVLASVHGPLGPGPGGPPAQSSVGGGAVGMALAALRRSGGEEGEGLAVLKASVLPGAVQEVVA